MKEIKPNLLALCDALILMERIDSASIDLVYLDPIWLTKKVTEEKEEKYYEYLFKVFQQSHRVLNETGNLVYFSDPSINLKFIPLISKVFKPENHVQDFIIPRNAFHHQFSQLHSSVIFYKKSDTHIFNNLIKRSEAEIKSLFPFSDDKGRYRTLTLFSNMFYHPKQSFEWNGIKPKEGQYWKYSKEKMDDLYDNGYILLKGNFPQIKKYADEEQGTYKNIHTVWDDLNSRPKKRTDHPWKQSIELLERIIKIGTNENGIVLDPFCGSGTTPIVASGLNRKWIAGDNNPEAIDACKSGINLKFNYKEEKWIKSKSIKWNDYELLFETSENVIWNLIQEGETTNVEFKTSAAFNYHTNQPDKKVASASVLKAIASFINSEGGGTLFIGVKDNKELVDLSGKDFETANPQRKDKDAYELYLSEKIKESLGVIALKRCQIQFHNFNGCEICSIKIKPSSKPVFFENDFYLRFGNGKKKLNNFEFYQYMQTYL